MILEAVTVSINYSDYLARCIERNAAIFDHWVIVTSAADRRTRRLCARYPNITVVLTAVRFRAGVTFPKSTMINEGFAHLQKKGWVVHIDSDILLPEDTRAYLESADLDRACMYGPVFRFMLNDRGERVAKHGSEFQRENIGYFQLFHSSRLAPYPEWSRHAGQDDLTFNRHWKPSQRRKLRGFAPFHFGPKATHWNGRSPAAVAKRSVKRPPLGFLYVATGPRYLREALVSAASFRETMPDVPIALFTDAEARLPEEHPFTSVSILVDPKYDYVDKIRALKASPFERTVFLDTDTFAVAPCHELFDLLDRFDLAAAHAPVRECWWHDTLASPESFTELNTGVIAFRRSAAFHELVDDWYRTYRRFQKLDPPPPHDQPSFRDAVYRSHLRFCALPPEYNTRSCFSFLIGGGSFVRILHDRGRSLDTAIRAVSRYRMTRRYPWVVDRARMAAIAKRQRRG